MRSACVSVLLFVSASTCHALDQTEQAQRRADKKQLYGHIPCDKPLPENSVAESMTDQTTVHVAYSSDILNFPGALASMTSLARNSKEPGQLVIHFVVNGTERPTAEKLVECLRRDLADLPALPEIKLHEMQENRLRPTTMQLIRKFYKLAFGQPKMAVPQMFVRNYLHEYLPGVRRVIWLDHDTIVQHDLADLYRRPMKHPIGVVREMGGIEMDFKMRRALGPKELYENTTYRKYFNAGVLLLDLEKWQGGALTRKIETALEQGAGEQLALNMVFADDADRLHWHWNVHCLGNMRVDYFPLKIPKACSAKAAILHWTCTDKGEKPWVKERNKENKKNDHLFEPYKHECDLKPPKPPKRKEKRDDEYDYEDEL